jgi:hypothetical protein
MYSFIGGRTKARGEKYVYRGAKTISQAQAKLYLRANLMLAEREIDRLVFTN